MKVSLEDLKKSLELRKVNINDKQLNDKTIRLCSFSIRILGCVNINKGYLYKTHLNKVEESKKRVNDEVIDDKYYSFYMFYPSQRIGKKFVPMISILEDYRTEFEDYVIFAVKERYNELRRKLKDYKDGETEIKSAEIVYEEPDKELKGVPY